MEEASVGSYSISWPWAGNNGLSSVAVKVGDQNVTEKYTLYYDPVTEAVSKDA